jgi:hypothetical protein
VRLEDGDFEAHAWVECDGVALNDPAQVVPGYSPLSPR